MFEGIAVYNDSGPHEQAEPQHFSELNRHKCWSKCKALELNLVLLESQYLLTFASVHTSICRCS